MTTRRATSWLAAAAFVLAGPALAQAPAAPQRPVLPGAAPARTAPASKAAKPPAARAATRPLWRELSAGQQQALAPLAAQWDTLNEAQKRKWIAMSANFPKLSGEEQAKLHSRMTEWVSLSPQQRTIARLNYGQTRSLAPTDKKAKWEAYQALSPEEKKKLAAKASAPKPPTTAAAVRPVPREKLAHVPQRSRHGPEAKAPRIAAAPNQVDRNTLLPQPSPPRQPAQAQPPPAAQPESRPLPPQPGTPD
ncbi:MAG TPA: DUF3106 domain-containing protein [Ramlibacter sp.]